eukprot:1821239-Rhodomonas_salina.1
MARDRFKLFWSTVTVGPRLCGKLPETRDHDRRGGGPATAVHASSSDPGHHHDSNVYLGQPEP